MPSISTPGRSSRNSSPTACQERTPGTWRSQALEKLPASDRQGSGVEVSGTVQLDADGASGTLVVAARGIFNRYNEAAADSGKFITGLLKKIFPVDKVEIKKLLSLSRREVRVEATFSGKWLKEAGTGFFSADAVHLPGLTENMVHAGTSANRPWCWRRRSRCRVNLDLQPAAGLKLEYAAPNVERKNELGYFSRGLVVEKNGLLRFSQSFAIDKALIGPEKYPLLRELLLPYFAPDLWLVFKKEK